MSTLYLRAGPVASSPLVAPSTQPAIALLSLIEQSLFFQKPGHQTSARSASTTSRRALVGPLGEVLLLDALTADAGGPLASLRGVAGLRRSLARSFAALGCAELGPQVLPRLCERLQRGTSGATQSSILRLAELGRLYQSYRGQLGPHRLDGALAFIQGVQALDLGPVAHVYVSELHRLPPWDDLPTPHGMMRALSAISQKAAAQPGTAALTVVLPAIEDEQKALEQALRPILDALYQQHGHNIEVAWAPLGPEVAGEAQKTPWGRFLRGLFRSASAAPLVQPDEITAEKLELTPLPSPRAEARYVARAIRDLISRGVPPSDIAVIAEAAPRRTRLVQELLRYDVPVYLAASAFRKSGLCKDAETLPLPPPLAIILSFYELVGKGKSQAEGQALAREGLIQLLCTRYLRWPTSSSLPVRPWQLARALRGAGVRDLALFAGADSSAELHRRILEWERQQKKHPLGKTADKESALLHQLEAIFDELRALPEQASLHQHVAALRRLCERLQLGQGALSPDSLWLLRSPLELDDENALTAAEDAKADLTAAELLAAECRALSRDQAALCLLEQILDELPRRAHFLRLHGEGEPLSRARFAALLRAAFFRLRPESAIGRAGLGVEVGSLMELRPRPLAHLFVVGLIDGELPAGAAEDPVLPDEDRRFLNRLLDMPVWPLAQHASQRAALYFAEALAHAAAAHLSWPIADEEGRPLLRSPFVETVLHAAARSEPTPVPEPLIPWPNEARHPTELWTRAGQVAGRIARPGSASAPAMQTLAPTPFSVLVGRDRRRAARLIGRVEIEATRAAWFLAFSAARPDAQPGPLAGQICDPRLIAALAPRLPGSRHRPLSASALEDYARCPFRFFVYRVLQAAPIPEAGEDLDPLANGNLYHKVLETFFKSRRDAGRLPLSADEDDRTALEQALEEALREFSGAERGGHPGLFQVRLSRLRTELWQLISREARAAIEPGCLPALLEHKFGPLSIAGKNDDTEHDSDENALHIGGVIDRIDLGPERALVLDYKTGRIQRYKDYLRGELLVTSFQLPLYAAAVKADPVVQSMLGDTTALRVSARYYAVRQAQVTEALDDPTLIELDPAVRESAGERNVAEAAYRLWRRLRGGDFRIAPRTCDGCGLESVCRIEVPPAPLESAYESADASGEEESADSSASSLTPPP